MKYDYQKLKWKLLVFVYDRTVHKKQKIFTKDIFRRFRYYPDTTIHNALSYAGNLGWINSDWAKIKYRNRRVWTREITMPYEVRDTVKNFWKRDKKKGLI